MARTASTTATTTDTTSAVRRPRPPVTISQTSRKTWPPSSGSTGTRFSSDHPTLIHSTWVRMAWASPAGTVPEAASRIAGTPNSTNADSGPARLTTMR